VQHFRQPVERGVGIGAADRLDEGGDGVVVGVAVGVVDDGLALDGFFGGGEVDEDRRWWMVDGR
jgi:hypothetical protein